jgi:hypothetical protein
MVTEPTQKRYCELILDGARPAEEKATELTALELLALGEIAAEIERRKQQKTKNP